MADLQLGDHVVVYEKFKGVIRYIGDLHVPSLVGKTWYGIELEDRVGQCAARIGPQSDHNSCKRTLAHGLIAAGPTHLLQASMMAP